MGHKVKLTSQHTGATHATVMTDSGESFTVDALIGLIVDNVTDGSSGTITDNAATTITVAALTGGTGNNWELNDVWEVAYWTYNSVVSKIYVPSAKAHMTVQAAKEAGYIQFATNMDRAFTFTSRYDRANCAQPTIG